jgi:hypothetical protein
LHFLQGTDPEKRSRKLLYDVENVMGSNWIKRLFKKLTTVDASRAIPPSVGTRGGFG